MKVSIGIPVHNGMPYIIETINSILVENYKDFEVIISDDQSTDGTTEWLRNLKNEKIKIINPPNRLSMAANWDFVLSNCTGDYIKIISADDVLTRNGLINQITILDQNPSVSAVFSSRQIIDSQGKILIKNLGFGKTQGIYSMRHLMKLSLIKGRNCFGETCAGLFRKSELDGSEIRNNPFNYLLDMSMYHSVLDGRKVFISNQVDSKFRIQEESLSVKSVNSHSKQFMEFVEFIAEEYAGSEFSFSKTDKILCHVNSIKSMQIRKLVYKYIKSRNRQILKERF